MPIYQICEDCPSHHDCHTKGNPYDEYCIKYEQFMDLDKRNRLYVNRNSKFYGGYQV